MSYFQMLKDSITCLDAAERYGLEVNASGMTRCPFHDDHTPSLKLSRGFHCFGCGAQGDVITLYPGYSGSPQEMLLGSCLLTLASPSISEGLPILQCRIPERI